MLSNKDIRVENGNLIINGEKHPIVQDTSTIESEIDAIKQVTLDDKNLKMYSKTFTEEINIATAWGGLYVTNSVLDISYDDLGLTERPAAVFLSVLSQSTAFFLMPIGFNEEKVSFHCVRTSTSSAQSATITALVVY